MMSERQRERLRAVLAQQVLEEQRLARQKRADRLDAAFRMAIANIPHIIRNTPHSCQTEEHCCALHTAHGEAADKVEQYLRTLLEGCDDD
jgi:hypothetical protein